MWRGWVLVQVSHTLQSWHPLGPRSFLHWEGELPCSAMCWLAELSSLQVVGLRFQLFTQFLALWKYGSFSNGSWLSSGWVREQQWVSKMDQTCLSRDTTLQWQCSMHEDQDTGSAHVQGGEFIRVGMLGSREHRGLLATPNWRSVRSSQLSLCIPGRKPFPQIP